jgi:hypothetical protein
MKNEAVGFFKREVPCLVENDQGAMRKHFLIAGKFFYCNFD